jgi:threonine dehydrogenase-like Zn-dependent dehydrogenase
MKALVIREPGLAVLDDIPEPTMRPGEALLRVRRVGLCGSDLNSFRGCNPLVSFPRIPGHEIAATIVALAEEHPSLAVGADVTLSPYTACGLCPACRSDRENACRANATLGVQRDGALTEYISVPVERLFPANLTLKELCLVEPLTVGFHAAARGRVAATDTVAVLGCGGVGLGVVSACAFRGATTIAIDIDDNKLATGRKAGAAHTIHADRQPLSETLAEFTQGAGPDVVIEAVGTPQTFRAAVEQVACTGRVVYIGYAKEPVSYETRLFVQKELDIVGSRNARAQDFHSVIRMLEERRFPVDAAVTAEVPFSDTPAIFSAWSANPPHFGKIMIDLD